MLVALPISLVLVKDKISLPQAASTEILCKAFSDSFSTATYDKSKWRTSDSGTVSISGGNLLISHTAAKTTTVTYAPGGLDYALGGDFGITLDMPVYTGTTAGTYQSLKFKAVGASLAYHEIRRTVRDGKTFLQNEVTSSTGTKKTSELQVTGTGIKVRITRKGSTAISYYQSSTTGGSWKQLAAVTGVYTGKGNVTLRLVTKNSTKVNAKFDNFVISCGTTGGVPKPPSRGNAVPSAQCTQYPQVGVTSPLTKNFSINLSTDDQHLVVSQRTTIAD